MSVTPRLIRGLLAPIVRALHAPEPTLADDVAAKIRAAGEGIERGNAASAFLASRYASVQMGFLERIADEQHSLLLARQLPVDEYIGAIKALRRVAAYPVQLIEDRAALSEQLKSLRDLQDGERLAVFPMEARKEL